MSNKTIVILQSNYIPWKGYFDLIRQSDEFIFYDEVQYTVRDWRNRNRIKTAEGLKWLTIPVGQNIRRKILEVEMTDQEWKRKHRNILRQHYKHAPYLKEAEELFEILYSNSIGNLSEYNQFTIKAISEWLGIEAVFSDSRLYKPEGDKISRLTDILQKTGAQTLLCGPNVMNYLKQEDLEKTGHSLKIIDYSGYPEYEQLYPPFSHNVSVVDLIVHTGKKALNYLDKNLGIQSGSIKIQI
jgi:hypothetical protein